MNALPRSIRCDRAARTHAQVPVRWRGLRALALAALAVFSSALAAQTPADLPGRVGRVADVGGELFLAPQDKPAAWISVGINYPVAEGDNLWLGTDGRAEVDFGGGQFRLAGDTSVHVSQLDDTHFSLFVAQGRVSVRVRALEPGDVATIDTPNAQVAITRPGLYRLEVTDDRQHTVVIVRQGEANVQTQAAVQQVLPGQAAYIEGPDPQFANVQNGIGEDGFDAWVATRDRLYRTRASAYVSPQMVGAADLDRYGNWQQSPEYGAVWYPNDVPVDWAPYRNGYWANVGAWGPTWVDFAPWGYAPFHYGRWAFIGGRWGWCPGVYTPRPLWAPALVAWTGGAGWALSVSAGAPVYGWIPLGWGEPFRPWWGHCSTGCWDRFNRPVAVNVTVVRPWSPPPTHWRNASVPGGITAVPFRSFETREPVTQNMVRVPRDVVASAPALATPPVVRNDIVRAGMGRPPSAPPPASSLQPTLARPQVAAPMHGAPGVPAGARSGSDASRDRTGMASPSASPPGVQGSARPGAAPRGAPSSQALVAPASVPRAGAVEPRSAQPSTSREARPGMAPSAAGGSAAAPTRAPTMRMSPEQSAMPAASRMPQPPSTPSPVARTPSHPVPTPPPAPRMQPQQATAPQPAARMPSSQTGPTPPPAPRMATPQAAPMAPSAPGRGPAAAPAAPAPMRGAPPATSSSMPAPHAPPQARAAPAAEGARQGAESGNAVRGERGREGAR